MAVPRPTDHREAAVPFEKLLDKRGQLFVVLADHDPERVLHGGGACHNGP